MRFAPRSHVAEAWDSLLTETGELREEVRGDTKAQAMASFAAGWMLHHFLGDAFHSGKFADTGFITERILIFLSDTVKTWEETGNEQGLENACKSLAHFKASIDLEDEAIELLKKAFDLNLKLADKECAMCHQQRNNEDAPMLTCSECKVACYCSIDHVRLHWRRGELTNASTGGGENSLVEGLSFRSL